MQKSRRKCESLILAINGHFVIALSNYLSEAEFRFSLAFDFSDMVEEARISARALRDFSERLFNPTLRLGITGLSRAGKTVFITALIHGLTRGGRFPVFEPLASGRIARARLEPQPDDAVPRFDYERHVHTLIDERAWPNSTVDISELRLVIDYQRQNGAERTLTLDIVDYPGEWLLDLPLLNKTYEQWSSESLALSRGGARAPSPRPGMHISPGLNAKPRWTNRPRSIRRNSSPITCAPAATSASP